MTRSTLAPAIDAPPRFLDSPRAGRVAYYADDSTPGRPLVLVHSLNAAPSAFEMKPLFESYRAHRPVYAIDLPGFGLSERGDRRYDPDLESAAIEDFMKDVLEEKADVVALSLGAELAARAASRVPERFSSLVLISPTGFGLGSVPGEETSARVRRALVLPGLGDLLFALLTSRPSLRFFLDRSFHGSAPAEMIEYAHATAHQPGAKYAAFCFLSGQIFTRDAWERLHAPLDLPALVLHDRDPNVSFERLPDWLEGHPERVARRIAPTCGLPHWEQPEQTRAALDAFWAERERADSSARS
ncbi:MAG: alpha/beta fold hydrolase [bacterium]